MWLNLPHCLTDSEEFSLPGFPSRCHLQRSQLHRFLREADGSDSWSKFFQPQIAASLNSCGWLCYTVEEIEPLGLEVLRRLVKNPVWCVGLLFPNALDDSSAKCLLISAQRTGKQLGIPAEKCIEWLDSQRPNSVRYMSFGSQNTISLNQMMELGNGIEESRKPFIWVIRPPIGFDMKGEFRAEWLPEGFEERVKERRQGLLVKNWARQLEILSHKSTGAFLSHCGWNSVLESLSHGVRIIGWPMGAEQVYNSKMLMEEMGVSVELTRGVESDIDAKEVKRVIELFMNDEGKGREMKTKTAEIQVMARKVVRDGEGVETKIGSSVSALYNFLRRASAKRKEFCNSNDDKSNHYDRNNRKTRLLG